MKGSVKLFFCLLIAFSVFSCRLSAQGTNQGTGTQQPVATTTLDAASMGATSQANKEMAPGPSSGYTQNEETYSLEKAISTYNDRYCPPETPIREIDQTSLIRLVRVELIKRSELQKYENMVLVDGKVYEKEKEDKEPEKPQEPTRPGKPGQKNLFGAIESAGDELEQNKTRGKSEGNKKPEQTLKLKRRKIIYRDKENQLKEMEMHSPPRFPAKKKAVIGKRGKKIKDYATTIMVPKESDGEKSDSSAFDDMPSADAWIDEGPGQ